MPTSTPLDLAVVRARFPSLNNPIDGKLPIFFDNPGGTQVPQDVIDAVSAYYLEANANTHGAFHTSQLTDQVIDGARSAMADLLNAHDHEIVFGPNMTSLTFQVSHAIGQTLAANDEIVVTKMDHDANISPWLLMARDHDLKVRWVDFDPEAGTLDMTSAQAAITPRTRLVACVYASNALGTVNDVHQVVEMAGQVGAYSYIDAVQYAPHGPIDVKQLDADFVACSAYKFFGPHIGVLYGKAEHLEALPAYKVRPASDNAPDRWETGTKNHEGMAGTTAAVDYLAWLGEQSGDAYAEAASGYTGRRALLRKGMTAVQEYERTLSERIIGGLESIPGVTIAGITEPEHFDMRVPTVIFTVAGHQPKEVASQLAQAGIYLWSGHYYAISVMERLGREGPGMVRVGAAHYNTHEEVDRFLEQVEHIATS